MKKIRVGIFGGTFNPPHSGHVAAAESFYKTVKPDVLMIIPDCLPPHKEYSGSVTEEQRLEMCKLAFGHIENVTISDMEIKRGGRSYTSVTLEELTSPDRELYFLCGTDMFLTLESWYRPEVIFDLATICYIRRETDKENDARIKVATQSYIKQYGASIVSVSTDVIELSSSELRQKLESRESCSEYLPTAVEKYIVEKGIYK